jgi:hypothetical protein
MTNLAKTSYQPPVTTFWVFAIVDTAGDDRNTHHSGAARACKLSLSIG